jgi:hypothetical protein
MLAAEKFRPTGCLSLSFSITSELISASQQEQAWKKSRVRRT